MSKDRPERLYFAGEPGQYISGIPARDLEEHEVAALNEWQLADALGKNPETGRALYRRSKPDAAEKKDEAKAEEKGD